MPSQLPPILYKYCDSRGIDVLQSHRLKVTPFDEFNDPFEIAPRMRPDFPYEDAKAAVTDPEMIRRLYETTELLPPYQDFERFSALIRSQADDLAARNVANYANDAAHFRETHLAMVSPEFGLICLSARFDDILMWAHYTRGHTGFAIGFRTSHDFFTKGPPTYEVEYGNERVLVGHYHDHRDRDREVIKELISRKSSHWSYEREWRQLRTLRECESVPDSQRGGKFLHYAPIVPEAICEVITGCRSDGTALNKILDTPVFRHVKRIRARIHETDFALTFDAES
ncbi:MAG TPA: DUF2971 domain-containing protein [Chthoniobacterales bacterium]|jgi:hypothetical protein|nr:DUF2971 domain-containing protein [Chthoniobacterales bacterium]